MGGGEEGDVRVVDEGADFVFGAGVGRAFADDYQGRFGTLE